MFSKISRTSVVALCISVVAFAGGLQSERAAAVGFTTATPDAPVQAGHGSGAIERVDAADRLLIASEELASAACHLHAGVAADEARSRVLKKLELFPRTIEALEFGASDLGIHGAETRRKTLKQIHAMRTIWTEMETPLRTLTEQGIPDPQKAALKASNVELVNTAENLFTEISGEYANPFELLAVDLLLLNISGRQALLAQRVAKEAC
ncbi:MAG: type IV pili methyl-accepting chemotaxis transducer N-terminal domain-containing protein [Pseudomonadota bacterium]